MKAKFEAGTKIGNKNNVITITQVDVLEDAIKSMTQAQRDAHEVGEMIIYKTDKTPEITEKKLCELMAKMGLEVIK